MIFILVIFKNEIKIQTKPGGIFLFFFFLLMFPRQDSHILSYAWITLFICGVFLQISHLCHDVRVPNSREHTNQDCTRPPRTCLNLNISNICKWSYWNVNHIKIFICWTQMAIKKTISIQFGQIKSINICTYLEENEK